ncbi:Stage V sporulation protein S [Aureococcus anophagefferens]|nr:Stage V sporulation protein S [Aureococcus anophagefferens]
MADDSAWWAAPTTVGNVAHKSDVRKTAGYVANHLRSAEHAVGLKAAGPPAINIAVKALCLARKYLADEGLGLAAEATFVGCDERPFSNEVRLTVGPRRPSKPAAVAGAVAHAFREEQTDVVVLHAMGAECVTRGLKAAWQAQKFLEGDGVVARIHPSFSVPKEGDDFKCKVELRLVATRRGDAESPKGDAAPEKRARRDSFDAYEEEENKDDKAADAASADA